MRNNIQGFFNLLLFSCHYVVLCIDYDIHSHINMCYDYFDNLHTHSVYGFHNWHIAYILIISNTC